MHLFFLKITFFLALSFSVLDTLKYAGFTANNFYLPALGYTMLFSAIHLLIRHQKKLSLGKTFASTLLLIAFPATITLAFIMIFTEKFGAFFPNFFFSEFGVDYRGLAALAVSFLIFGLIHSDRELWSRKSAVLNITLTGGLLYAAFFLYLENPELYKKITSEDNIIEYLAAVGFVMAGILCLQIKPLLQKKLAKNIYQTLAEAALVVAALGFFLIAGEEISWGQRLLGITTPDSIAEINRQREINLHNLESFWPFVYKGYLLLGIYGASLWLMRFVFTELIEKTKQAKIAKVWLDLLVPNGYLFLNFSLIIVYVILRERFGPWRFVAMEELSELLLCAGIVLHLLANKRSLQK